jgi:hypothetical protein
MSNIRDIQSAAPKKQNKKKTGPAVSKVKKTLQKLRIISTIQCK